MKTNLCISPSLTVRDAISALVDGGKKVVFIVSEDEKLLGLFTNGDMRRYLLTRKSLSASISQAMNPHPVVFYSHDEALKSKAKQEYIVYPIVSTDGRLLDALFCDTENKIEQISDDLKDVPLVIMAGGKGTRLYPYTKILPKAIIPIGDYSITERIIQSFHKYGCCKVYMVLNYKAGIIKAFMRETDTHCDVDFVHEEKDSGTAGGLYLLKDKLKSTFFLSNCDVLINDDLACAYKTHIAQGNQITYICAMKNWMIPYGVVETENDGKIRTITEKPQFSFLVSTGVYIIEPCVLEEIEKGEFIHIPDLTERCVQKGMRIGVFPVSEKAWLDMGQIDEMKNMLREFESKE